jgi:spermidine synthase
MRLTAYIIFILSGAAGLIYESIWARYLGLFVGHTAYSQVLVLAMFLGGMSIGAMIIGQRSQKLRDPLRGYAFAELALAVIALVFHGLYLRVTGFAYDTIFPALAGTVMLTAVKWGIAGALILPQAILLGMTFPLMAAGVLRRFASAPGQTISLLYFSNSLGAAAGVLVAGFYLLKTAGLPGTLLFASLLNLTAALVSYLLTHRFPLAEDQPHEVAVVPQVPQTADAARVQRLLPFLLAVSFGTALASFIYEIGWLRMLALVLGSATHSFELMLSAFILGLALGAFWVRNRSDRWKQPLRALGIVQWVMGFTALATLPLYIASFGWTAELLGAFAKTGGGYAGFTLSRYIICLAVMLPSTFCAGITLPLITRTLLTSGTGERAIGAVYGINTLGSIVGVITAGLIALPLIGLKALLITGAVLDMALGVWILFVVAGNSKLALRFAYAVILATVFVTGTAAITQRFDPTLLASGVYRRGSIFEPGTVESVFHADGRTATISVLYTPDEDVHTISTNGKPDASLYPTWFEACSDTVPKSPLFGDASTQTLAPLITLAHNSDARRAAVIGQGSGMSSQMLLASDAIEELITVEIEPEMIRGSRLFYPANRRVFDDPRSTIVIEDARTYFAAAEEEFDLILSEPSNPWVSGVSSLFTTEFYQHIRRYLADDGVFGQWIHLYEIDDALVLSIVAALHENFRSYEIFLVAATDMLLVASEAEVMPQPDWSVADLPELVNDLCNFVRITPEALEGTRVSHRAALAPLLDDWGQGNSDFYPVVDLLAERARYLGRTASGFTQLAANRFNMTAPFFNRATPLTSEMVVAVPRIQPVGARALSATLRALRDGGELSEEELPVDFRVAIRRWEQWLSALEGDRAPSDWRLWVSQALAVEAEIGRGTAGVADEAVFSDINEFLDRHDAPELAREAIALRYGIAAWDFGKASRATDALMQSVLDSEGWILPDEVLFGGVVAKLRLRDFEGATSVWEQLGPQVRQGGFNLRLELLKSYLDVFNSARGS